MKSNQSNGEEWEKIAYELSSVSTQSNKRVSINSMYATSANASTEPQPIK